MAELADAPGSGPGSRKGVEVRVLFRAPVFFLGIHAENTGKQLWKFELPAGGQATPMMSSLKGKQSPVISAGGHGKLGTTQGHYVTAFNLP
jgi:glucose dehydrogenase